MSDELQAAVIGYGAMGRHHARIYRQMDGVQLFAVCDFNPDALARAEADGIDRSILCNDADKVLGSFVPEIVSICVPTSLHRKMVGMAASSHCSVLVEKPIAGDAYEASQMVALMNVFGGVLAVGHIERYNPAAIKAKELLGSGELGQIRAIHARRLGPNPERVRDVGVVVDLAVHDIDLMRWMTGADPRVLASHLCHFDHGPEIEDGADALLDFGGVAGSLTTNWLTSAKIRDITIVCEKGTIVADLFHKKVQLWTRFDQVEEYRCPGKEPLAVEIGEFVKAVHGEPSRIVTAEDATIALKAALEILRIGGENARE